MALILCVQIVLLSLLVLQLHVVKHCQKLSRGCILGIWVCQSVTGTLGSCSVDYSFDHAADLSYRLKGADILGLSTKNAPGITCLMLKSTKNDADRSFLTVTR